MPSNSPKNTRGIKAVSNINKSLVVYASIGAIFLLDLLFYTRFNNLYKLLAVLIGITLFIAIGILRYENTANINKYPAIYVVSYHILLGIFIAFMAAAYSPYIMLWIIVAYLAYRHFGANGFAISLLTLFLATLNQAFRLLPATAQYDDYIRFVGIQLALIAVVSVYFCNRHKVDELSSVTPQNNDSTQIERQRLTSLINSMGDGVVSTDEKGLIKLYNAAALNILDTNDTLENKNIRDIMNVIDQSAKTVDLIAEVAEKNINIVSTTHLLVYPNGEKINLYLNISPIKLSYQQNIERGYIISFRDITHEKSLEEERNEFISVVSHELRTPIAIAEANISNAQFMVDKGNEPASIKTSLEAAHKQALFLANMINDLSTLSRAERGKLDMKTETIDPREIMKSLQDDYSKEIQTKNLELHTEIDDSTPTEITSNRLYVREILQNFVTNSIKYTKEGSISINLRGREGGIEFAVSDTGIGISKSDQKRVFDKFFRSEDFRTRESSGTGLGLYVTNKLMHLINATVTIKSKLNEGSTFTVFIPNLKPDEPEIK